MTTEDQFSALLGKFRRLGLKRWTDGINLPSKILEHIVTITNHIKDIQNLADEVIQHVDGRAYGAAHRFLDDIEKNARAAHRHIDHLQNVTDFCARPAGPGTVGDGDIENHEH